MHRLLAAADSAILVEFDEDPEAEGCVEAGGSAAGEAGAAGSAAGEAGARGSAAGDAEPGGPAAGDAAAAAGGAGAGGTAAGGGSGRVGAERAVLGLDAALRAAAVPGVVETVPGLTSLLVQYDCLRTSHDAVAAAIEEAVARSDAAAPPEGRLVALPLCSDPDLAPDLATVAARCGRGEAEVVELICSVEHRVAMLGNLPGLPYLVGLPTALWMPRRDQPRESVPAGSVAIAAGLTCVYPVRAPAGWQVVGRTVDDLFDAEREPPCLLGPGDRVRFEPVARERLAL